MLEIDNTSEKILKKIKEISAKKEFSQEDYFQIRKYFYLLNSVLNLEELTRKNIDIIFEVELNIADSKKKHRQKTEKVILDFMSYLPIKFFKDNASLGNKSDKNEAAILLTNFAKKVYAINIPRDSFSGKRKSYAIEILKNLTPYFDVPEFIDIAKEGLKNKNKTQFIQAAESLQEYFKETGTEPNEEIVEIVNKRYSKAKTKIEVMACLQFLVETTMISENAALMMLDNWKEKYDIWY